MINESMLARLRGSQNRGCPGRAMQLSELNYAPEIASGAEEAAGGGSDRARRLIVDGAVSIAQDAVTL